MSDYASHNPVMLNEVLQTLEPKDGEVYVDGTFGAGGYSEAILKAAKCKVYGIDRDETVKPFADKLSKEFPGRFEFLEGTFGGMYELLKDKGVEQVDGIVLDLGVSSMQVDQAERGFSFNKEAKLDMRMGNYGITAHEVVNELSERELADIIYKFGDEVKARQIARKIVALRSQKPIETTIELADIVRGFYPKYRKQKIDPATKTFQAIRIYVNDELGELERALEASKKLLRKGGKLIVVSFHSLEDSIVKKFLRKESGYNDRPVSRYEPMAVIMDRDKNNKVYEFLSEGQKLLKPSEEETKNNPRARSSRLRMGIKN